MKPFEEFHLFNCIFVAMGMVLLSVVIWIGANVAHIPAIEQKIEPRAAIALSVLERIGAGVRNGCKKGMNHL